MNRFFTAPFLLLGALATVFILPKRGDFASASVIDEPPLFFGEWTGKKTPPSKEETAILDKDTIFNKAVYHSFDLDELRNAKGEIFDSFIHLSIVKSGTNVNNSIHRPERCLLGQGHQDIRSIPSIITTPKGRTMDVKRLTTWFPSPPPKVGDPAYPLGFISYYYFVGHKKLSNDHWQRTYIDVKDRLIRGTDQQWAFIMVSMPYKLANDPAQSELNQQQADKKIRQLLAELTDEIVLWDQVK
jgi:hypothetical protein